MLQVGFVTQKRIIQQPRFCCLDSKGAEGHESKDGPSLDLHACGTAWVQLERRRQPHFKGWSRSTCCGRAELGERIADFLALCRDAATRGTRMDTSIRPLHCSCRSWEGLQT